MRTIVLEGDSPLQNPGRRTCIASYVQIRDTGLWGLAITGTYVKDPLNFPVFPKNALPKDSAG